MKNTKVKPNMLHKTSHFFVLVLKNFFNKNTSQIAASLTYTTLLSIVPILTVLLIVLSTIPALESTREQIYSLIYSNLMPQSSVQLKEYINKFTEQSFNLTAVGIIMLFVTTVITLIKVEVAFNHIWDIDIFKRDQSKSLFKALVYSLFRHLTIIAIVPLVLGIAFVASAFIQGLSFLNQQIYGYAINWAIWAKVISYSITAIGFTAMYWFIPKVNVPIKSAFISGVIISLLFEATKFLFAIIMSHSTNYSTIYGAFAALPILLIWIHISWNLILLGVILSHTLTKLNDQVHKTHV
ncbi:YhjD/YihY/BrkB family envelope integrity protein [Psychrobacter sp. HD31]|uniref:YhjD/YihY/BrkB family envelope integrity protein n=1 Tax=Psychrobacter sp. HD31 TaxID=3112003 RepID=UPI003DA61644